MTRNDLNPDLRAGIALGPCIGLLELSSVARGVETADAILWQADLEMLFSSPVQPGRYVMLFTGGVRDVASALERGAEIAGEALIDRLQISQVHEQLEMGLRRTGGRIGGELDAIGLVETGSVASAIVAADLALKTATVDLLDLRIANGLGGKSFFTLTGEVSDVRSSIAAGAESAERSGQLEHEVVIPRPHPDLVRHL
jgi:microcompartment protein CcmL/EutN